MVFTCFKHKWSTEWYYKKAINIINSQNVCYIHFKRQMKVDNEGFFIDLKGQSDKKFSIVKPNVAFQY